MTSIRFFPGMMAAIVIAFAATSPLIGHGAGGGIASLSEFPQWA
jgi:hypothetical protein